jgi:hypothetical protein
MEYRTHRKNAKQYLLNVLSVPFIWSPLIAFLLLDFMMEIYHQVCFPIYGIEKVKRSEYINIMDRNKLQYLSFVEKLNCMYCGYVNGGFLYMKEIAGRTEKHWCGIMHENKPHFKVQKHQIDQDFAKFNDEEDFHKKYGK